MQKDFINQRKEPRVPLRGLHNVSFFWMDGEQEQELQVANISRQGIGFLKAEDQEVPDQGVLKGRLCIDGKNFEVHPKIIFSNKRGLGCQLTDSRLEIDQAVEEYFASELIGLQLKENQDPPYECSDHLNMVVLQGGNNCEVLSVTDGNELVRYRITFFGHVFDGGKERDFTVGELMPKDEFDDDGAVFTRFVTGLDSTTKSAAVRFVNVLEDLSGAHRQVISQAIQSFPEL